MINENSTKREVLEAVKQDGWSLGYASDELRGDKNVVLAAVKNNQTAFDLASEELQKDLDVITELLRHILAEAKQ